MRHQLLLPVLLASAALLIQGCASTANLHTDNTPALAAQPAADTEGVTVTVRTHENGDTIEEYRENGRLTMVKITPANGLPYTLLDTNGDGLLDRRDSEGPVGPVYYTLYRWN